MAKPFATAAFIFRRDLRLDDNTGLRKAFALAEGVLPCFIFDPRQQPQKNDYFTAHGFQFLIESLEDLERQLQELGGKLYRFSGLPHEIVERLVEFYAVEAVFVNRDYTPFSRQRDAEIQSLCAQRRVFFGQYPDLLLNEPGRAMTEAGAPFVVFTPYHGARANIRRRRRSGSRRVTFTRGRSSSRATGASTTNCLNGATNIRTFAAAAPGVWRYCGGSPISSITASFTIPWHKPAPPACRRITSSARSRSARSITRSRANWARRARTSSVSFTGAIFNPSVFGRALKRKFDTLEYDNDEQQFQAWCEGHTGYPIVDAGMRQLNETGWMHNRARLITGSFLTKDLHINWRWGERYFARRLVDYDPCVNNGNWQWIASVGADTRPIRILNPWTQQQKYDPQAEYVKRWVPELRELTAKEIHQLNKARPPELKDYPSPMVDHAEQFRKARRRYEQAR